MPESDRSNVDYSLRDRKLDQGIQERKLAHGSRGSSGGGMEAWQQSVENRLVAIDAQIRDMRSEFQGEFRALRLEMATQFRWLIGWLTGLMVVLFGGLLTALARGFGWL